VVAVDQFAGAAAATQHLLELGHRTVWHIAGPDDWQESRQRVAGWRHALEAAGAEARTPLAGDWSARAGYELGQRLMAEPDVTAVFVANDQMALGVMQFINHRGLRIPGDIGIVGFDNIAESAFFSPALTTIQQDQYEIAELAVAEIITIIEASWRDSEPIQPQTIMLPPALVVRQSSLRGKEQEVYL
jgi:LacI family transcriptional regulator